ncbi:cysteine-rich receptor-like protein kinase 8 [Tanacetum coccineum]
MKKSTQIFLYTFTHPGLILISKKLTGSDNYNSWKRSLMIALNAKNKMKIITGEFIEPRMDSELRALWERNNDMLISWILNTLKQENSSVDMYYQRLKGLWDEFDVLEAPYLCLCVCSCANGRINGERDQRKRLIQFLMGKVNPQNSLRQQMQLTWSRLMIKPLKTSQVHQNKLHDPPSEDHVSARMDQLQNQINQVLLMLQQNGSHGPEQKDCTWKPL